MTKKSQLTDLQLVLLSSAAQRPNGMLLPPPDTIRVKGKTLERSLTKLLGFGLIEECPARAPNPAWRNDANGRPIALRISAAGREALGLDEDPADVKDTASPEIAPNDDAAVPVASADILNAKRPIEGEPATQASPTAASVKPGTKQAQLVDHLSRPIGASIADIVGLLGWQPHTVRAALTGLRKKGYQITNTKDAAGLSVYRATAPIEAIDDVA